ncbi:MAG: hypothetical protein R6W90_16065 [Ignavibacteriaceae bacterium]
MSVIKKVFLRTVIIFFIAIIIIGCSGNDEKKWEPNTDWGHWILGHKTDPEFLEKNNMTITFGSGAPNVDEVTRAQFDSLMKEAKKFNESYHDKGYIVLRYLSTSLNGNSESNQDVPKKEQINFLKFYNERWNDFEDYIGPKPSEDPTTWIMAKADGSFPYYRYAPYGEKTDEGFEAWGVPVNPGYLQMMEGRVRAQAETGIDGSYIDWTHIAEETSYDEYSKKGFIEYLNKNLPANIAEEKYGISDYAKIKLPEKRGEKFWMEWITYRGTQVAEFHKHMRTVARKYNPHFMVSGNVFGGFGFGPIAYLAAGNIEMLGRDGYDDFIYSEMQEYLDAAPRNKDGVKITNSPALKYVSAAAHGKPVIVYATEITPPIFPNPTEKCLSAMAQINIAEAVANHCIFREKRETPPGATEMYSFLAKSRPDLIGSHLYSNIAILGSVNQYLADEQSFAFSTSRIFTDKGISHVFIVEDDLLTDKLNEFDLIILPRIPLLSPEKQNALLEFVNKGGKIIVLGSSGIKNQYNLSNKNVPLLEAAKLSEYPEKSISASIGKGIVLFIPLDMPAHKYLTKFEQREGTFFGSSMVDVFADVPEAYTRDNMHPELRKKLNLVAEESLKLLNSEITMINGDSKFIEISTMKKNDEHMLVHLVNYNVTIDGDITPAKNINVQIALPKGFTVKNISYSGELSEMKNLKYDIREQDDYSMAAVTFPGLNIYGLAKIELEKK